MTSPVISSSMIRSPISVRSEFGSSRNLPSLEYIFSTSSSSVLTALTRSFSAGAGGNWSGRIMSGFMGLVEFGIRWGSQVAAGRSYQAVEGSPCIEGIIQGASFVGLDVGVVAGLPEAEASESEAWSSWKLPWTTSRSSLITLCGKYPCSSHRSIKSCSFAICLGQSGKDATVPTSAGSAGRIAAANLVSPSLTTAW